jgi:hypothetical protein
MGQEGDQRYGGTDSATSDGISGVSRRAVLRGGAALGLAGAVIGAGTGRAAAAVTGPAIRLSHAGRTNYQIYVGTGENAVVQHAAAELASYLNSITSATFHVVSGGKLPNNPKP